MQLIQAGMTQAMKTVIGKDKARALNKAEIIVAVGGKQKMNYLMI